MFSDDSGDTWEESPGAAPLSGAQFRDDPSGDAVLAHIGVALVRMTEPGVAAQRPRAHVLPWSSKRGLHPDEALARYVGGQGSDDALFASLAEHQDWLIPVMWRMAAGDTSPVTDPILFGMQTALPPGEIWVFSEMEHAERAAHYAALGPYQRAAGISVFGRLLPATGGTLIVNPHIPGRTLVLAGQWAAAARAWANAIALEVVLASDWSNDQVLEHVRAQPNLMLLTHQGMPAFSEGSGHKRGVAVFTSPDNLAEFGKIGGGPVERAVVDGQTLIDLVLQHDCDLITFNNVGPGGGREIQLDP